VGQTSGEVVLMTLVGGVGPVLGPAVAAAFIVTLQNELADKVGPWITVIMGPFLAVQPAKHFAAGKTGCFRTRPSGIAQALCKAWDLLDDPDSWSG